MTAQSTRWRKRPAGSRRRSEPAACRITAGDPVTGARPGAATASCRGRPRAGRRGASVPAGTASTLEYMPEFIYQMRAVRKSYGDKVVLDDGPLAFLPGAKNGGVGPNGPGQSKLT